MFQKWTKKESQKNVRLFKTKVFFFAQESGKDKKKLEMRKLSKKTKNSENHRNHKEGQTEQDKHVPTQKKHNKEAKVKTGGKRK